MSLLDSQYSLSSNKKWDCIHHQNHEDEINITTVYIGKEFAGPSRFYCQYCLENEDEHWSKGKKEDKIKIAYQNIIKYKQIPVEQDEPTLEKRLPLDANIKQKCREQIKLYEEKERKQQQKLSTFINSFRDDIDTEINNSRIRALKYFEDLKSLGQKLEERYYEIVDCSKISEIINNNPNKEELFQKMQQFVNERLDNTNNNKELERLYKEFNDKNGLYITEQSNMLCETILNYTKKVTFDSKKITSIDKFEDEVNTCMAKLKLGNQPQQKKQPVLFSNISKFNYKIENHDPRIETLTSSSQNEECFAKFTQPLQYDRNYEFIFKITNLNQNQPLNVTLGLGDRDELSGITYFKKFFNPKEDKCNFVQQGKDLSIPTSDSPDEIIVVMSFNQSKNKFYFTDKYRMSKNLMQKRVPFLPTKNYGLYVHSVGLVSITLLHFETQEQS
ncbi:hypothetical protein ABPG72_005978 [Tetrahymena utriculariae]